LRTKGALIVLLGGIIGGGFGTSGIFVGSAYAGAAVTPCIVALSPLFSIVGAHILFGEKITCRVLLAACVIIVGAILVYSVQMPSLKSLDSSAVLGIVGATIGALGWGLEGPISAYVLDVLDTTVASFIRYLVDATFGFSIVIFALGSGDLVLPAFTSQGLPFIFIAGISASSAFIAWFRGLSLIGVERGTAILNSHPLFTILLLVLIGQKVSWNLLFGGILMVSGLFVLASEPREWLQVLRAKKE
jgi:drug/metabolite transporter (DMT)-like permease